MSITHKMRNVCFLLFFSEVLRYVYIMKTNMNIEYILEMWSGALWEEYFAFDDLSEAIKEKEKMKSSLPRELFRIIKCEWQVIEQ